MSRWLITLVLACATAATAAAAAPRPPVEPVLRVPGEHRTIAGRALRFWAVDGHVHSDVTRDAAHCTLEQVAEQAARVGLDAVFVTEHNVMHDAEALRAVGDARGVLLYPGEEAGFHGGHLVVWGGRRATRGAGRILESVVDMPRGVPQRDVLTMFAHPGWWMGRDLLSPDAVRRPDGVPLVDAVEVWNGQLDRGTDRVLARWELLLAQGIFVPVLGNSDSHHRIVGWPRNMLLAPNPSLQALVRAARLGRGFVTDDGWVELDVLGHTYGALLALPGPMPLPVWLRASTRRGGRLRVLQGGVEVASERLVPGDTIERLVVLSSGAQDGWLRVEIRREGGTLRAGEAAVLIGNPVRWDVLPLGDFWR